MLGLTFLFEGLHAGTGLLALGSGGTAGGSAERQDLLLLFLDAVGKGFGVLVVQGLGGGDVCIRVNVSLGSLAAGYC